MNHLIENPVGIDKPIKRLQKALYDKLEYSEGYGRIYKTEIDGRKEVPSYFLKDTQDYIEVLTDDSLVGSFFFVEYYRTKVNGPKYETQVDIIFQANIERMYPNIKHRADEEMMEDVMSVLERFKFYEVTDVVKGINALTGFHHQLKDYQPYSYLKITGNLYYQLNC